MACWVPSSPTTGNLCFYYIILPPLSSSSSLVILLLRWKHTGMENESGLAIGFGFSKHATKRIKSRLDPIRKKKQAMLKFLRKDVADLLANRHDINAFGRVIYSPDSPLPFLSSFI